MIVVVVGVVVVVVEVLVVVVAVVVAVVVVVVVVVVVAGVVVAVVGVIVAVAVLAATVAIITRMRRRRIVMTLRCLLQACEMTVDVLAGKLTEFANCYRKSHYGARN